ncbi:tyrosine recombinase [Candidatus Brocadia sinica JPN1]|uniref:Tyrosine recombinase n=2 Tax=Candidatus Brocadiaceae TaxID=1127830 RepID=A0ABQ0JT29_9BACT|nr:tyrosine-type recombinase/integrase [Planctomycetota bacterium]NUO03945.1 site-specific integrase [Candidatus Brocadia sinica]GAN31881.1 tyrosine recombinase [Candidatus Brocadia sinica JPN1]GIK12699.1 MAG: hypothetical protein BroJett002_14060 [Candidatus Brocadia sinica]GJQ18447.1 MAG: hypothetical protein HBSIN01_24060 [Candidatus Brocadia sinica]
MAMFIGDRERGKLNLPKKKVVPTFVEYCQRYLEHHKGDKENTRLGRERAVNALTKYLGDYRLDKLTPFIVERFKLSRQETDKVGAITVNHDLAILSHLYNTAIKEGVIDGNPCKDVKRLKAMQSRDRVLSESEIRILLNTLQGHDRMAVLLGLFCGLRLNETLKLTWDNFDFTRNLLTFTQSKTGKQVTVPFSDFMVKELTDYKGNCKNNNLFEDSEINQSLITCRSKHFKEVFERLGIHGFTYHCLRHTFASLQGDLGTGAVTVKEMLGHSDLSMTLKYSHIGLDSKRRDSQALTDHILTISERAVIPMISQAGTA